MPIVLLSTTRAPAADDVAQAIASAHRVDLERIEAGSRTPGSVVGEVTALRPWLVVVVGGGAAADRLAIEVARAGTATLVVRDPKPLLRWLRHRGALRTSVFVAASRVGRAPLHGLVALETLGPCHPRVTYVVDPEREHRLLGLTAPGPGDPLAPAVLDSISRDMRSWADRAGVKAAITIDVQASSGALGEQIAAAGEGSDLVVVGVRAAARTRRTIEPLLARATGNVLLFPPPHVEPQTVRYERVLVATDLSRFGDGAAAFGYAMTARGGEVHLAHVAVDPTEDRGPIEAHLRGLVPKSAAARRIRTELEIIVAVDVALGLARAAERHAVHAICMASRARSGFGELVLGSVTRDVLRLSRRPVLLVPPERDDEAG